MQTLLATLTTAAESAKPAGGAAIGEVVGATAGALVATTILFTLIYRHRTGKTQLLEKLAGFSERLTGMPGWASLPSVVGTSSLLVALLGMYWDIALHINVGRDEGPLANPAHYLILVGLFGIFAAGCIAVGLPKGEKPTPSAVRIAEGWYAPVGAILIALAGGYALLGFPLDDMWHRLFGQDVTLWGPTHLMLIGGAGMTLIGQAILLREGRPTKDAGRAVEALRALRVADPPRVRDGRPPDRPLHLPGRVRLRRAAVPHGLPARADRDRRRHRAGRRAHLDRPGRCVRRRLLLPRRPRRRQPDRRPCLRRDDARAAAVPGRCRMRRDRRAPDLARASDRARRCSRRADRNGRLLGRMGLVAGRDAAAVERELPARGADRVGRGRRRRRPDRRPARRRAARQASAGPHLPPRLRPRHGRDHRRDGHVPRAQQARRLQRGGDPHRRAVGAQARGDRAGPDRSGERRRGRELGPDDLLAGRRPRRRRARADGARHVRVHQAGAGLRRLEDDAAPARGQRAARHPGLHA